MAEIVVQEKIPSDEEIEMAGSEEKVGFLDPDFLLIFFFALIGDFIGGAIVLIGILALISGVAAAAAAYTTKISAIVNIIWFVFISLWMYWRLNRIAQSKKAKVEALQKRTQQLAKSAPKIAQQLEKAAAKVGAKVAARLILRVGIRGLVAFLGSIAPFIGLFPFWSITVVLTLRER